MKNLRLDSNINWIILLFNIIKKFQKFKLFEYYWIKKFSKNSDLRKQDFLSEEKISHPSCFVNKLQSWFTIYLGFSRIGKLRGLQPRIYTNNVVYILKHNLIGSNQIRTRDFLVSSLMRCHLSYCATVYFSIKYWETGDIHCDSMVSMCLNATNHFFPNHGCFTN